MRERAARDVTLARAIEASEKPEALISPEERHQAGRTAAEMARWQATQQRIAATEELFLEKRAGLLLDAVGSRSAWVRAARRSGWRPWIGIVLPAAALVLGALTEQVADRQHVNVLAFPLLALIAWNVAVYVLLLLRPLIGSSLGPIRRWLAGAPRPLTSGGGGPVPEAGRRFISEWSTLAQPLHAARAARVLHLSAALFALGALLGLYLRAMAFEYRIGWESTFLQASTVHAFLSWLLGPAARLLGMPFPPVEAIEAMRITGGIGGSSAGPWIHMYAVTVGAVVIVPRLALAAWAAWRERRHASGFRFELGAPYFRRVLAAFSPVNARVRIAPYSYTLDESAVAGLGAVARHLFGPTTQLALRPSAEFGEEESAAAGMPRREDDVTLLLAVFNASSIPENENHGRFLETLRNASDTPIALLVDLGPYRRRLGSQAGADDRLDERRRAWQSFATERGMTIACIDLGAPDLTAAEADLAPVLGTAA
jgi:hypothetical protein